MCEASIVVLWLSAKSTARLSGSCSAATIPQKKTRDTPRKNRTESRVARPEAGFMSSSEKKLPGKAIVNECANSYAPCGESFAAKGTRGNTHLENDYGESAN